MHHHPIPGQGPDDPESTKQALLSLLCSDGQPLWALSELDRLLAPSTEARTGHEPSHVDVEDAVADLYGAGLIHRVGQFVFATHAAHEAQRLAG